jgi:hypothetical protein
MASFNTRASARSASEPEYDIANPPASSTLEALRGIGYDASTAIADILDNSISAGARNIRLDFRWDGANSSISIMDDGHGMTEDELSKAMILGSRSPLEVREETDLGRFGLGLKTASFSQARRLVVGTKAKGHSIACRQWNLDYVIRTDEWRVLKTPTIESADDLTRLGEMESGTVVRWERMDVLVDHAIGSSQDARESFWKLVEAVRSHLGMVFHRYLTESPRIRITINGNDRQHEVEPWDPFCRGERFVYPLPDEPLLLADFGMKVAGFILPHRDNFSSQEAFERAAGPGGWNHHQGFFVYRNRRLLSAGGWLGLGRPRPWTREEQYKLGRIQLDIPNSLDAEWRIDVKKAQAKPPALIRNRLTEVAEIVRAKARGVFAFRGQYKPRQTVGQITTVWTAADGATGLRAYRINPSHPVVVDLFRRDDISKSELKAFIRLVECTVPIQQVWLDVAERPDRQVTPRASLPLDEVKALAESLYNAFVVSQRKKPEDARDAVLRLEPFNEFPEIVEHLLSLEQ